MLKGATGKRIFYFTSAFFRFCSFIAFLIAFIVVKVTVNPEIVWLNYLLIGFCFGGLISAVFNLILCGYTATAYKSAKASQIICVIITALTGGIASTTITLTACITKVTEEEIQSERIIKIKK